MTELQEAQGQNTQRLLYLPQRSRGHVTNHRTRTGLTTGPACQGYRTSHLQETWHYCTSKMEGLPKLSKDKAGPHRHHGSRTWQGRFLVASRNTGESFDIVLKRQKHILVSYEVVEAKLLDCWRILLPQELSGQNISQRRLPPRSELRCDPFPRRSNEHKDAIFATEFPGCSAIA
jgi:hypothetical protein